MASLKVRRYKVVPGLYYGSPKELWGFKTPGSRRTPQRVARDFLSANASLLMLDGVLAHLKRRRIVESAGATHVIFEQRHLGRRIHRGYVTVHVGRDGHVFLAKNRAVPRAFLPAPVRLKLDPAAARRRARKALGKNRRGVDVLGVELLWFPRRDTLRPAYRVRLARPAPPEEWIMYVDAVTGGILSRYDNLAFANGTARVFDPNPVVALGDWRTLMSRTGPVRPPAEAYADVALAGLGTTGLLDGNRVTTARTARRVQSKARRFVMASHQRGFEEVMAYFHVDRAIRYLESLGYAGRRRIFGKPIEVNARGTREDDSWYSPGERRLTFGTGGIDDAEDAEVILHELGHAIQDAICPDFGQSVQAAAMGEGFGDYFAASFFASRKTPKLRPVVMSWDGIEDGGDPPFVRRLDEQATFESFDGSDDADEHVNGQIWSATLWEIWNALGRATADRIVIESHFQLDGFTTFARGARAILDADRNLFAGRHARTLRRIFAARGIGPVQ